MANDSLLPLARLGLWALFGLAAANGVFLYALPQLADTDYAWSIAPQINAAAIGAGYLAGMVATGMGLVANRWRLVRPLVPGLAVLAVFLLAATAIDSERFRWDYPPTWAWTAVYAAVPVGLAVVWRRQGGFGAGARLQGPGRRSLRGASAVLGVALVAVGALLFAGADILLDSWAWELTPLVARVVGGWYLLAGTVLLAAAAELRRAGEAPIAYATVGSWSVLLLALPALHTEGERGGAELAWWVAVGVVTLVLCTWGYGAARRGAAHA